MITDNLLTPCNIMASLIVLLYSQLTLLILAGVLCFEGKMSWTRGEIIELFLFCCSKLTESLHVVSNQSHLPSYLYFPVFISFTML